MVVGESYGNARESLTKLLFFKKYFVPPVTCMVAPRCSSLMNAITACCTCFSTPPPSSLCLVVALMPPPTLSEFVDAACLVDESRLGNG